MCNRSCELDSVLFVFLLISLVSVLFSARNHFVCYFWLLKFTLRKNRLNTVYASDNIQQKRSLVSKLVEDTFNHWTYLCKDVLCKISKQIVNASHDRYKIPSCWYNLFQYNRSYAYIKQIIWKKIQFWKKFKYEIDYIPKIAWLEWKYF